MGTRIIHLADVHWRGLSRHSEYRDAFEKFFEKARDLNPDLIYIGGDIFHSKTQGISPELIDCLIWWFRGLAEIAPTHVILGNHDGIMTNLDRQDAISPVISALNDSRIHLYKKSGCYSTGIPGFNWCVFSCFDEKSWPRVQPVEGEINIAVYHGAVWGSKTDIDWKIEGEVDVDFFKKYDFGMLGDIHRCQFLTNDKRIAYCGSSIQQNYGESTGKGFLLWDITSRDDFDVTFHEILHSKPFITIDWAGSVSETMLEAQKHTKGSRFRVRTKEPIPQAEITQIKNELDISSGAAEVVFQDKFVPQTSTIEVLDESLQKSDLRDPETLVRLLQEHLKNTKLDDEDWELIEEIVRKNVSVIARSDVLQRCRKWSVKKMTFSNTFGYGANNLINFENLDGITGILGRNRRGKSSIIGTLMLCIFNTTDRGPIKNIHVINTRKSYCRATVDLAVGEEVIRIDRQSVRRKNKAGEENALTHLNLWRLDEDGEEIEDLSAEQRRRTEKLIRKRVGTAEDFLLTSLATQGEMNTFIKERATARKAYLTKFLGLDVFDQMLDLLKEASSDLKAKIKTAPDRDWDALIDDMIVEKRRLQEESRKISAELAEMHAALQEKKIELSGFSNVEVVTPADVEKQEGVLSNLESSRVNTEYKITELQESTVQIQDKLTQIDSFLENSDSTQIRESLAQIREIDSSLRDLHHEHENELARLKRHEKSVKILTQVPCGDQYPKCKFISNSHEARDKIEDQVKRVEELLHQIDASALSLSRLDKDALSKQLKKINSSVDKSANLRLMLSKKMASLAGEQTVLSQLGTKIQNAEAVLSDLQKNVVDTDDNDALSDLKRAINKLTQDISTKDATRISTASRIGRLEGDVDALRRERDQYKELRQKWRVYDHLLRAMSKRGIPLQIIQTQLPVINAEIAKILSGVSTFTVELVADPDSNAMDVFIDYGDSRRIIEMASGMEKMFASLAIRVALINVSSLPKTDMLIIDEGFGNLDDVNVEACNRLLVSLKKWFRRILIITHVDAVKDVVDNVIDITWNGKDAQIIYE